MTTGFRDILYGLVRWRLWSMLAWENFQNRYHRTILGPIWLTVSFLAFVSVKIFIFGAIMKSDGNYYAVHLTLGFLIWNYLSTVVNGATQAFVGSRNWILGVRAPLSVFVYEGLFGALMNFIFISIAAIGITFWLAPFHWHQAVVALLGMVLLVFSMFWVQLILAIAAVFFRDLVQLVQTIMRIMFFLTPILWLPDSLGSRAIFVDYNPFTHYVAIVRSPLIDGAATQSNYLVVIGLTAIAMVLAITLLSISRKAIPSKV